MDNATAVRAADVLVQARLAGRTATLPDELRPTDEDQAYAIQDAGHRALEAAGRGPLVGYKLGATAAAMQQVLGIPAPTYGGIPEAGLHHGEASLPLTALQAPGIECEVVFRLGADVPAAGAPYNADSIAEFVDACMAGMEIADNRYGDFKAAGAPLLIADDFFHAAVVVGPPVSDWRNLDLSSIPGRIVVDGQQIAAGTGAAVMGNPLNALAWLANTLATRGRALTAGQIVFTGSVVPPHWLPPGPADVVTCFEGLGDVRARFT